LLCAALSAPLPAALAADGAGPGVRSTLLSAGHWQGRASLVTAADPWRLGVEGPALNLGSLSLMADYYLGPSPTGMRPTGGLRATGGLIVGSRSMLGAGFAGAATGNLLSIGRRAWGGSTGADARGATGDAVTLPYLGIGYTGLSPHGGWGFSADLGLLGQAPGDAWRLGRAGSGAQALDEAVRELRMTPLLQLGVSYAF
jgi:hypothetical protein